MVVILEAVSGPVLGRRIEVRGGSILRIGRTGKADYPISEDGYLSGIHFSVECDGAQCRIRDLGSSNGTFVNGSRITEQVLQEGDSVAAGGSTFLVHIDLQASPTAVAMPRVSTAPTPLRVPTLPSGDAGYSPAEAALLSALYAAGDPVFGVVDASRDSRIPTFLEAGGEKYLPLSETAFVVALPADSRLVHVLIKDGWGRGWGFYGTSRADIETVRAHFAGFMSLQTSTGAAMTLRFWDPRVLRALLPAMPKEEAEQFLGPCERIIVEAEELAMALQLGRTAQGLSNQTLLLS